MFSHPMRRDSADSIVTIPDYSDRAAAELAGHVLSTIQGEQSLGPRYGIPDPSVTGISETAVAAALALCEPEIVAGAITVSDVDDGRVRIHADVNWAAGL